MAAGAQLLGEGRAASVGVARSAGGGTAAGEDDCTRAGADHEQREPPLHSDLETARSFSLVTAPNVCHGAISVGDDPFGMRGRRRAPSGPEGECWRAGWWTTAVWGRLCRTAPGIRIDRTIAEG
jgi:hypothetical protein